MNNWVIVVGLLAMAAVAYQAALTKSKGMAYAAGGPRLHSRPVYHGVAVALWTVLPAAFLIAVWLMLQGPAINALLMSDFASAINAMNDNEVRVFLRRIANLASGFGVASEASALERDAAQALVQYRNLSTGLMVVTSLILVATGLAFSWRRIQPAFRARVQVERTIKAVLIVSSVVAILTTIGIVLSMVGETFKFFTFISPADFFFGTIWNPRFSTVGTEGQGSFGMLPLLWGTLMVAGIALLVAVPLGLMSAIYLAEYAPKRVRAVAKPVIEVLAGIPTIVYGFFAVVTIGPLLSQIGDMLGLEIRATSALTAGVVMGIMIIPFISSLSDDIITQVPKSLRDGSLGLGATRSETIKRVVLPAALPGIVGAILLAASRAIGETMIVVLAAGNSPVLTANPFDAVSTMTVTIVKQLTGDQDFASPQSLVAFALGLTLFVITLCLNVIALIIVRRYREQYD
ncbi:MAG: phosphate ABC transporter permease subunit PstC [Saccharospirillum sp.]